MLRHRAHKRGATHADVFAASTTGAICVSSRSFRAGDEVRCVYGVCFLCVLLLVKLEQHPTVYERRFQSGVHIAYHLATLTFTCSALESNL